MVLDTVLVGFTAEFLVASINGMVASNPSLSAEWVGLILLPIVSTSSPFPTKRLIKRSGWQRGRAFHCGLGLGQGQAGSFHLRCCESSPPICPGPY